MSVDKATVAHIAKLARLRVTEDELETLAGELSHILGWVEQLSELDTEGVEPMTSVVAREMPLREDEVTESDLQERVTRNAPEAAHGFFTVPKVVE